MKYLLSFLVFLFVLPQCSWGQHVVVTVRTKTKEGVDKHTGRQLYSLVPTKDVVLYGFWDVARGKKAMEQLKGELSETMGAAKGRFREKDANDKTTTGENGKGTLRDMVLSGYIVAVHNATGTVQGTEIGGKEEVEIVLEMDSKMMNEVTKTGQRKRRKLNEPMNPEGCGNTLHFNYPYHVDGSYTLSNGRVGIAPFATLLDTGDTVKVMRPAILDGKEFQLTMNRRMGYDVRHDFLNDYKVRKEGVAAGHLGGQESDSIEYMTPREPATLWIRETLYPIDENSAYPIYGYFWVEDYNGAIETKKVLLSEGYAQRPMRFLKFSLPSVEIDTVRYRRVGQASRQQDTKSINVQFENGKSQLDFTDSLTRAGVAELKAMIHKYVDDPDAGISSVELKGYASPEGILSANNKLSEDRVRYFKTNILDPEFPSLQHKYGKISFEVTPWEDVAKELERRGYADGASYVRSVVEGSPNNMDAQWRTIRGNEGFSKFLRDSILPRLRKVDFSYQYYTYRVRDAKEILELYNKRKDYQDGSACKDYELYQLFRMFASDYKRLEPLARAAYNNYKDELEDSRPWPLAAYYLGRCYLERGQVDTTMLKPYLETDTAVYAGYPEGGYQRDDDNGNKRGWFNDPAIVALHIAMLCKAKDYRKAFRYSALLPNTEEYEGTRNLLKCLDCRYREPDVRDAVAKTSLWNKIVVFAAQSDSVNYQQAALLELLSEENKDSIPQDASAKYQEAVLRWVLSDEHEDEQEKEWPLMNFEYLSYEDFEAFRGYSCVEQPWKKYDWGYPMVECCMQDEKYLRILKGDGFFSKGYKKSFEKWFPVIKKQILERQNASGQEAETAVVESSGQELPESREKSAEQEE